MLPCGKGPSAYPTFNLDLEGPSGRLVVLARELTKIHEEFLSGTPEELKKILTEDLQKQKGEFVVIVEGK